MDETDRTHLRSCIIAISVGKKQVDNMLPMTSREDGGPALSCRCLTEDSQVTITSQALWVTVS